MQNSVSAHLYVFTRLAELVRLIDVRVSGVCVIDISCVVIGVEFIQLQLQLYLLQ